MIKEAVVGQGRPNKFKNIAIGLAAAGAVALPFAKPSYAEGPMDPNTLLISNTTSHHDGYPYIAYAPVAHDGIATTAAGNDPIEPIAQPAPEPEILIPGCPAIIYDAFGVEGCAISYCESGWDQNATGALGEKGYFQIHPIHEDSTYDPAGNVAAAVRISNDGQDWSAWSVRSVLDTPDLICPNERGAVPRS